VAPQGEAEFRRHLRQGVEQLRRYLVESAAAELAACAKLRPDDPELLFHQARLVLFSPAGEADLQRALSLLDRAAARDPGSMKIHRLAMEVRMELARFSEAYSHKRAIDGKFGAIGEMESQSYLNFMRRDPQSGSMHMPPADPKSPGAADYVELSRALAQLEREGSYAPSRSVPVLERLMQKYPDLLMARILYAQKLIFEQVRVNFSDRPDLPLMSSKLIFDYAQSHLERIFDQVAPSSQVAVQASLWHVSLAMKMGDFDLAVNLIDGIFGWPQLPEGFRRDMVAQKGLARYKQGQLGEAIGLFRDSLAGEDMSALDAARLGAGAPIRDIFEQDGPERANALAKLWTLHVIYDAARTPAADRRPDFPFRKDLPLSGFKTPMRFEDIAPLLRVDKLDGLGPSAWADIDHDGDQDLYVSGMESYGVLLRNDLGVFTDVSQTAGLFHVQSGFSSTFADFDNDGWRDLYIGRDGWNGPARNALMRNNGRSAFVDVTEKAGVGHPGSTFVHVWLDYDRDGWLDLYLANGITGSGDTNALYRNNGNGTFSDVTSRSGLLEPRGTRTIGVCAGDYDRDGWPDLFVSGYMTLNRLYRNRGNGTFEEVANRAGVDGADHISTGYVSFFFDYNNDTHLDILRTSLAPWPDTLLSLSSQWPSVPAQYRQAMLRNAPKLYRGNGNGTFTEVSAAAGLDYPLGVMGTGVADLDNDGFLDIYFGTGDPKLERLEPDRFFRNNGDGTFTDLTFATGLGNVGKGHGVTFVDLDGDGDLEIYAQEGGFVHGDVWPNALYLNKQQTGNHWLHIDLEGVKSNRDAVGAELLLTAGRMKQLRSVQNGEGF
ncbi:MAG: VCBS repeat-containing protein, partial [Acidobacteria bacterium]|nr:VCBS repeat-containing protein [Acidobacteriota bacterium]